MTYHTNRTRYSIPERLAHGVGWVLDGVCRATGHRACSSIGRFAFTCLNAGTDS